VRIYRPESQRALANQLTGPWCPLSRVESFCIQRKAPRTIGQVRNIISSKSSNPLNLRQSLTRFAEVYRVPVGEIHLDYGGRELHNEDSLAEHDIKYGSVISACTGGNRFRKDFERP